MSCRPSGWTERERKLLAALAHLMHKDHELDPTRCYGCRDLAAWLAVPGYDGELAHPEVH